MLIAGPDTNATDVLRAFHHDAPYLFAGAAFVTVALMAAAFVAVQRKVDPLLIYFALFAGLYGLRLWVQADLLKIELQDSDVFWRVRAAIDYLMPLPALLFFTEAMPLRRRWTEIILYSVAGTGLLLTVAVLSVGPYQRFDTISRAAAILGVLTLVAELLRKGSMSSADLVVFRRGTLIFSVFVLIDNFAPNFVSNPPKLETIGFIAFLSAMGYVAARRTLKRDNELNEIQKELEVARRMQLSILPNTFPPSAHFHVAARYVPMTSVAGDFYDYVVAGEKQTGLLIADVSGHGIPAALIASMVKLAAASQREHASAPSQFLSGMNVTLYGNTQEQFVTAAYLYLNATAGELRYAAAGHPALLLARDGAIIEIEENGLMLAAFDFATYSEIKHPLKDGDRFLMYTDGLLEAADAKSEFFGRERLAELLTQTATLAAPEAADRIIAAVRQWSPIQGDDLTVILCDFRDSPAV